MSLQRVVSTKLKIKLGPAPGAAPSAAAAPAAAPAGAADPEDLPKGQPYSNQCDASEKIMDYFLKGTRFAILHANEQSGKTGTYQYTARVMFDYDMIDRVYILSGCNTTTLKKQCQADVVEWHGPSYGNRDKHIQVLFLSDYDRKHRDANRMNIIRTLIIIDESHLVCEKDQTLSEFLQMHGLTMNGVVPEDTYILSVSATPYAEMSALKHGVSGNKGFVHLVDGENYYGIADYHRDGLIKPTFDLSDHSRFYNEIISRNPNKYFYMRISEYNQPEQYYATCEIARRYHEECDLVYFTTKYEKGQQQIVITRADQEEFRRKYRGDVLCMEIAPPKFTIVLIDGRFKCGDRIPKRLSSGSWHESKNADTDTLRQAGAGRHNGYQSHNADNVYTLPWDNDEKPVIYLPSRVITRPNSLSTPEKNVVVNKSDLERSFQVGSDIDCLPRFASHIRAGSVMKIGVRINDHLKRPYYSCVPIQFQLPTEAIARLEDPVFHTGRNICDAAKNEIIGICLPIFRGIIDAIDENMFTSEQFAEIRENLSDPKCSLRRFREESSHNQYSSCIEAVRTNTAPGEHIYNCPFLTFGVTFSNYTHPNAVPGRVFAIMYTRSKGKFDKIHMLSRIPVQDGQTHFTLTPAMRQSPAGMVVGLRPTIFENPTHFEEDLDLCIRTSLSSAGVHSRRIESMFNGRPIMFLQSVYGVDFEVFRAICRRLMRLHAVRISHNGKINVNLCTGQLSMLCTDIHW